MIRRETNGKGGGRCFLCLKNKGLTNFVWVYGPWTDWQSLHCYQRRTDSWALATWHYLCFLKKDDSIFGPFSCGHLPENLTRVPFVDVLSKDGHSLQQRCQCLQGFGSRVRQYQHWLFVCRSLFWNSPTTPHLNPSQVLNSRYLFTEWYRHFWDLWRDFAFGSMAL